MASNPTGSITLSRDINVPAGPTGNAMLGNTIAPDAATAGGVTYSGVITLGTSGSSDARTLQLTAAPSSTVTIAGAIRPTSGYTGTMGVTKVGAGTLVLGATNTFAGPVTASAGTMTMGATQRMPSLTVANGALANLTAGSDKVLVTGAVTIGSTGKLDLANNGMIVDYTGATPLAAVRNELLAGYGASKNWTGTHGITSSMGDTSGLALGVIEASEFGITSFAGQSVDSTALLVRLTRYGDVNLSGTTDFNDLGILLNNYNKAGGWSKGDLNYSGNIDSLDLGLLLNNYNKNVPPLNSAQLQLVSVAVPEPSTLALAALGLLSLAASRRLRRPARGV